MNWSYIAGFFDGEGSITHNSGIGFRISIPQTNEEVLNEIRNFAKVGNIIALKKRRAHWSDSWIYYIANKKDVCMFLEKMLPYLVLKKIPVQTVVNSLKKQILEIKKRKRLHDTRKSKAKLLKLRGWNYRKIAKKLKMDWGYARRLILDLA